MRRQRRLQQNCSEEEEMTTLIAKMKLSQSSAELAIFTLKKERETRERRILPGSVPVQHFTRA